MNTSVAQKVQVPDIAAQVTYAMRDHGRRAHPAELRAFLRGLYRLQSEADAGDRGARQPGLAGRAGRDRRASTSAITTGPRPSTARTTSMVAQLEGSCDAAQAGAELAGKLQPRARRDLQPHHQQERRQRRDHPQAPSTSSPTPPATRSRQGEEWSRTSTQKSLRDGQSSAANSTNTSASPTPIR